MKFEHEPGIRLRFANPGGLMPRVHARFKPEENGQFAPIRGESELRNPTLADVFFGRGQVDKAGSGLPDVRELMPKHGGSSSFACLESNTVVAANLFQALQQLSRTNVASRLGKTETFVTNLLPFRVIPSTVYQLPLRSQNAKQLAFASDLEMQNLPIFLLHDGWAISFADFGGIQQFSQRNGYPEQMKASNLEDFVRDENSRRLFVWLIGKHWNLFLKSFSVDGLRNDFKRKRAYFGVRSGTANTITYVTRTGRKATREVVKLRGPETNPWYENEGFCYQIVQMSGEWTLQVKPTYVFTGKDGREPLPGSYQAGRATRRFKFDRNKMVEDDLSFWARYLGKGAETLNLGRGWGDDVVLSLDYAAVELPIEDQGAGKEP